jgi:hypothetical protein
MGWGIRARYRGNKSCRRGRRPAWGGGSWGSELDGDGRGVMRARGEG